MEDIEKLEAIEEAYEDVDEDASIYELLEMISDVTDTPVEEVLRRYQTIKQGHN
jgi:hypothetical protein